MTSRFILFLFLLGAIATSCSTQASKDIHSFSVAVASSEKMEGLGFVGPPKELDPSFLNPIQSVSANWLCLMPYAFCKSEEDTKIQFDHQWQWWGEKTEGVKKCIEMAQKSGLKIFLKPHLWIGHGKFTGDFEPTSESTWKVFEESYVKYLMHHARIAEEFNVEMFCLGTEMKTFSQNRTEYWLGMIDSVRSIYSGKITYAANWDEYKTFPFWDKLDYIGIDAYFPLSDRQVPKEKDLLKSWNEISEKLERFSSNHHKQIVFTEIGYRSCEFNCKEPWRYDKKFKLNLTNQETAYHAFFKSVWKEEFFAGAFLWKWYPNHSKSGGITDARFTPQNKPVEALIKQHFSSN